MKAWQMRKALDLILWHFQVLISTSRLHDLETIFFLNTGTPELLTVLVLEFETSMLQPVVYLKTEPG